MKNMNEHWGSHYSVAPSSSSISGRDSSNSSGHSSIVTNLHDHDHYSSVDVPQMQEYLHEYYEDYEKNREECQYQLPPAYGSAATASPPVSGGGAGGGAAGLGPPQAKRRLWRRILIPCLIVLSIVAVVLIVLGVLYLKERDVDFTIMPLSMNDTTIDMNPNGFVIPIDPTIEAHNDNFFNVHLNTIVVQALHPDYANGITPLGYGTLSDVTLENRADTTFKFPLLFTYNSTLDPSYTYFEHLLRNCSDASNGNLYLHVTVHVDYSVWAKSGTKDDTRDLVLPCPITMDKAERILQLL